ncbi:unnamed protein product [Choristocarpus tenellus]
MEEPRRHRKGGRPSSSTGRIGEVLRSWSQGTPSKLELDEVTSELRRLDYTIERASYSCPDGPAENLRKWGKGSCWKGGGTGSGWILLELEEKSLLSFLRVHNKATTSIQLSISVKGTKKQDFVTLKSWQRLPHNYVKDIPLGHLPCRYIKLECRSQTSVSLFAVQAVGLPTRNLAEALGPSMEELTFKSPELLLFGPSLRASQPPVACPRALKRLSLPPYHRRMRLNSSGCGDRRSFLAEEGRGDHPGDEDVWELGMGSSPSDGGFLSWGEGTGAPVLCPDWHP